MSSVLVTGAGGGIGLAIVRSLLGAGYGVFAGALTRMLPLVRAYHGHPLPKTWLVSSMLAAPHQLTRVSDHAFLIEPEGGVLLATELEQLYRSRWIPLGTEPIRRTGVTITVAAFERGLPRRVLFTFDESLDDDRIVSLHHADGKLRRFRLPAVGEAATLRPPPPSW